MCLIIARPANKPLDKALLEVAFDQNDHGFGVAIVKDGRLIVDKGLGNFDKFFKLYQKYEHCGDMLIHFRVASAGMEISKGNCHPFYVDTEDTFMVEAAKAEVPALEGKDKSRKAIFAPLPQPRFQFAIVHNGRLPYRSTKNLSDTRCFVMDVLEPILHRDPWFLDSAAARFLLQQTIGDKNKVVVMRYDVQDNLTKTYLINKHLGHEAHGCWFSNYSYIRVVRSEWEHDYGYAREALGYGHQGGQHRGAGVGPTHHIPYRTPGYDRDHPDAEGWYWQNAIGEVKGHYVHKPTGLTAHDYSERNVKQADFDAIKRRLRAREDADKEVRLKAEAEAERREVAALAGDGGEVTVNPTTGPAASTAPKNDDPPFLLLHLDLIERARYRKIAMYWVRVAMQSDEWSVNDAIDMLRDEVKALLPHLITYQQIDRWVLERTKDDHLTIAGELERLALEKKRMGEALGGVKPLSISVAESIALAAGLGIVKPVAGDKGGIGGGLAFVVTPPAASRAMD